VEVLRFTPLAFVLAGKKNKMEIQSLVLCKELRKGGEGNSYDSKMIGIHSFFAKDGNYPLRFSIPFYMLLRREQRYTDETITIRFNLIDADGRNAGLPDGLAAKGIFPDGHMFMTLTGTIEFEFPAIGDYRLDVTADEEKLPSIYHYNIEVTQAPSA